VRDARPAGHRAAEPQDGYDLARFAVPEDALEAAEGARASQRTSCEPVGALRGGDGGVGFAGGPVWVCGEGLHDWGFGALGLEELDHEVVFVRADGWEGWRGEDEAHVLPACKAEEEEDCCVDEGAEGAFAFGWLLGGEL
jgi:hypothetical protein